MKKFISIFVSIAVMLSITAGLSLTAQAGGYYYESENNNTYQKADTIPLGGTICGRCDYNDVDYYKFTLKSNSIANIYFNCDPTSSDGQWDVDVYMYNGNNSLEKLDSKKFYCYDGSGRFSTFGLPSGTYYIKVYAYDTYNQYEITVSTSVTESWETEFNDTYQTADPISLGKIKYGNSVNNYNNDIDYYKFTLTSPKNISVSVSHKKYNINGSLNIRLYRYNGSNSLETISTDKVYFCDPSYTSSSYGLSAGTYFIQITDYKSLGYNYGLTVNDLTKPGKTSITSLTNTAYGFKVNWSKVSDTTGYQIQYSTKSNFSGAATVYGGAKNTTSNTITGRACGTKYYVRVRTYKTLADGSRIWGNWSGSKAVTTTAKPSTTSIKSVSGVSCGFKINWSKISNTTGYQIQYSTNSNFSGAATVYGGATNTTSTAITGRARNTKYYVRVRTYKTLGDGTRVWGNWTSAKAVYTK